MYRLFIRIYTHESGIWEGEFIANHSTEQDWHIIIVNTNGVKVEVVIPIQMIRTIVCIPYRESDKITDVKNQREQMFLPKVH